MMPAQSDERVTAAKTRPSAFGQGARPRGALSAEPDVRLGRAITSSRWGLVLPRFLDNPFNAFKAAVEVCAIPKLAQRNVLTILSLERYQVLGGPDLDASWSRSEKRLLSSANPVSIDFTGLQKINAGRAASGIEIIHPEPPIFTGAHAGEIRLGRCRPADITLVRLTAP